MPSIDGLKTFVWSAKYKNLTDSFELFQVTAKCPNCDNKWNVSPTKTLLTDSKWSLVHHTEEKVFVWMEGWAKLLCPKCNDIAAFHFGIHREGSVTVGPSDETFDDEWWVDLDERRKL